MKWWVGHSFELAHLRGLRACFQDVLSKSNFSVVPYVQTAATPYPLDVIQFFFCCMFITNYIIFTINFTFIFITIFIINCSRMWVPGNQSLYLGAVLVVSGTQVHLLSCLLEVVFKSNGSQTSLHLPKAMMMIVVEVAK